MNARILLVEDDQRYAARLKKNLALEGYDVILASSGEEGIELYGREPVDLVLSDIKMPGMSGMDLLKQIGAQHDGGEHEVPVVLLTSVDTARMAVEAMKAGAADYITKDADRVEILLRIEKVLAEARIRAENRLLRSRIQDVGEFGRTIAEDPKSITLLQEIDTIADSGANILIIGETGVGKELIARCVHQKSPRSDKPFIDQNCAAIPTDNLFQSEIFGHEKGAFTGAINRKLGKLELADGGILFLDEIGDMPLESQGKILRALETQEFERVGGTRKIRVDIAIIAATNKDLQFEVREGRFRQDLLYRLDIIRLQIPSLRERPGDIIALANHFLDQYTRKYRRPLPVITEEARAFFERYPWPGNVRELKNFIERIVIRNRDCEAIDPALLQREGLSLENGALLSTGGTEVEDEMPSLEEIERRAIVAALEKANWVQSEAARMLDISPDRMHARVKKYKLQHPSWRARKAK